MKKKHRDMAGFTLVVVGSLAIFLVNIVSRAYEPDASETRLFLDYWEWYIGSMAVALFGLWVTAKED